MLCSSLGVPKCNRGASSIGQVLIGAPPLSESGLDGIRRIPASESSLRRRCCYLLFPRTITFFVFFVSTGFLLVVASRRLCFVEVVFEIPVCDPRNSGFKNHGNAAIIPSYVPKLQRGKEMNFRKDTCIRDASTVDTARENNMS